MSRVCIFVSYVLTLLFGGFCGVLVWSSLGQWLMVSVYGASGDTRLWGVRIITLVGVVMTVVHFTNFWTWYFDTFQELVTRHRLLFSMTAPGLSEESHTIGQILFVVVYMLTSWALTTGAFLLGLLLTINIARGWWGRDAVFLGSFIGLFVGMGLSGGISPVVDKMFSINRLSREVELGLFARFFGGGGRPRGTAPGVLAVLVLAVLLVFILAIAAFGASSTLPTAPSTSLVPTLKTLFVWTVLAGIIGMFSYFAGKDIFRDTNVPLWVGMLYGALFFAAIGVFAIKTPGDRWNAKDLAILFGVFLVGAVVIEAVYGKKRK